MKTSPPQEKGLQPQTQLAVVSPCSQCKNQRDVVKNGKSACPRRALIKLEKELKEQGQPLSSAFAPSLLKGTEGTPQASSDALRNPVYSDDHGHILVWVAHLQENVGVYDADGNAIVAPLLDGLFDTDDIQCNPKPYLVRDSEAVYFMTGAYKEWDFLEVTAISGGQVDPVAEDNEQLQIAGLARKTNIAYSFPRNHVEVDLASRGT